MPEEAAVNLRNVTKIFRQGDTETHALDGASLEAKKGELLMVVGPSGSGKTTLLSIIAGTLDCDEGKVDVFGHPLHLLSREEITTFRREHIGFIFQTFHLIPTLTALENIVIPLLLHGVAWQKVEKIGKSMLEKMGLKGRENAYPKMLSGGENQRVAIARALIHEPRLLICDEPTAMLDADTGHKTMELIREVGRVPGRCVIVVTHDARIFDFADRIVHMDDGKIRRTRK